jgi:hypothetical protein
MADMAKIHTIDGVQYREVAREVRVGDKYIVPIKSWIDITAGKPYKVVGINRFGRPEFYDDNNGFRECLIESEYVVLEPVGTDLYALESELAAMKAKVAEMERQLADAKAADRLKVGDYAKVVNPTAGFSTKGQIVKITEDDGTTIPFNTEGLDGRYTGWYLEKSLVRATDEEVAEAKRKLARDKIQPGVYVKLQIPDGSRPRYGWGDAKNGDIGKVVSRDGDEVRVDFPAQSGWKALIHELVLATEEERKKAEETDRKREESEKWAAIGRKPGEFKVGDIAKIVRYQCGLPEGTIFGVTRIINERTVGTPGGYGADIDCIELVAPVESVVNLRATSAS